MYDHTRVCTVLPLVCGIVNTSSLCDFPFAVIENNVSEPWSAAAHQNQSSYGNECISSATTSPLILLFMQWSQSSGLLGKSIHIYAPESAVIADFSGHTRRTLEVHHQFI